MSRLMLVLALLVPLVVPTASSRLYAWGAYNPPPGYPPVANPRPAYPSPSTYHWNPNSSSLPLYPQEGVFQHNPPSSYGNNNNPYAGEQEGNWDEYGGYGYGWGGGWGGEGFYSGW